jgi:hypothetical protein
MSTCSGTRLPYQHCKSFSSHWQISTTMHSVRLLLHEKNPALRLALCQAIRSITILASSKKDISMADQSKAALDHSGDSDANSMGLEIASDWTDQYVSCWTGPVWRLWTQSYCMPKNPPREHSLVSQCLCWIKHVGKCKVRSLVTLYNIWKGLYMHFAIRAPKCACNYMLQFYVAGNACIRGRIHLVFIRYVRPW